MKTSNRFDRAIEKLYEAFHANTLNPEYCNQCAVGNICDNTDTWKYLTEAHGSCRLSYLGHLNEGFGRRIYGFLPSELLGIETAFLKGCGYSLPINLGSKKPKNRFSKETLFAGLCGAVAYLCELEGIENVMDCTQLFDFKPAALPEELMV